MSNQHPFPLSPVKSSQIHAIGHDPATNTLAIQFKSKGGPGSIYHYANVSTEKHSQFAAAESKGSFFRDHIKHAVKEHPYKKWEAPKVAA